MAIYGDSASVKSPVSKYLQFKDGKFSYYDKEKGENIDYELKEFFYIAEMGCISGFNDETEQSIYSNEVYRGESNFHVRTKSGVIAQGPYKEIKDTIVAAGGKYTASIYAYANGEIVNIKLKGAGLQGWIEREGSKDADKYTVLKPKEEKKGRVKYFVPQFAESEAKEDEIEHVKSDSAQVAEYIDYLRNKDKEPVDQMSQELEKKKAEATDISAEDLPF